LAGVPENGIVLAKVVVFGNAKAGVRYIRAVRVIAIDPPLKALVWQHAAGTSRLSIRAGSQRHGLGRDADAAVMGMAAALAAVATASSLA